MWDSTSLLFKISVELFFFRILFFSYCSFLPCVACVVSVRNNLSFFSCFYEVFESSYRCIHTLTRIVCQRHLWDVRPNSWSFVFWFSGPFIKVLPSYLSRMAPSIVQEGLPRCLFLWWDSCYSLVFRNFLICLRYTFQIFSFLSTF